MAVMWRGLKPQTSVWHQVVANSPFSQFLHDLAWDVGLFQDSSLLSLYNREIVKSMKVHKILEYYTGVTKSGVNNIEMLLYKFFKV